MIKTILWLLLVACFLTGCASQTEVPTVVSQKTPVPTTESTVQQFKSESLAEATPVLEAAQAEIIEETKPVMKLKINDTVVEVLWEDNESVEALFNLVLAEPLTIRMSMYGGFEQVGSIGSSLPRNDVQTTTSAGDIVLYSGSQIVVFYGSNSWACDCDGLTLLGENEALRVTGTEGLSKRDLWYPLCRRGERDTWIEGDPGYRSSI